MLDWKDMERLRVLAGRADRGAITPDEKGEVRQIMAKGTPSAWDFAWDDLLEVAFAWLGVYALAKMGDQAAAADAS
jgi:hypothetical protein